MTKPTPSERITDAHNKGQTDGSKHQSKYETYDPPNSTAHQFGTALLGTKEESEILEAENKAYDDGFDHGRSQR